MGHKTKWTADGCYVDLYDEVTSTEMAMINEEFCVSSNFDQAKFFVRDLTHVQSLKVTDETVIEVAYISAVSSGYKNPIRAAYVVQDPVAEGLIQKFALHSRAAGSNWNIQIFKDARSAREWASSPK